MSTSKSMACWCTEIGWPDPSQDVGNEANRFCTHAAVVSSVHTTGRAGCASSGSPAASSAGTGTNPTRNLSESLLYTVSRGSSCRVLIAARWTRLALRGHRTACGTLAHPTMPLDRVRGRCRAVYPILEQGEASCSLVQQAVVQQAESFKLSSGKALGGRPEIATAIDTLV